jgi:hypothetical protein
LYLSMVDCGVVEWSINLVRLPKWEQGYT